MSVGRMPCKIYIIPRTQYHGLKQAHILFPLALTVKYIHQFKLERAITQLMFCLAEVFSCVLVDLIVSHLPQTESNDYKWI